MSKFNKGGIYALAIFILAACLLIASILTWSYVIDSISNRSAEAVVDSLVNDEVVLACDTRGEGSLECYFERWR